MAVLRLMVLMDKFVQHDTARRWVSQLTLLFVFIFYSTLASAQFRLENAYLINSEVFCSGNGGEFVKVNNLQYCKMPVKIPTSACQILYALDVSKPANRDVVARKRNVDGIVNLNFSQSRRDAKTAALNARYALMQQGFARQNPRQWDFEQGFVPTETDTASPMQAAYRYYLTWLEKSCIVMKLNQPDF